MKLKGREEVRIRADGLGAAFDKNPLTCYKLYVSSILLKQVRDIQCTHYREHIQVVSDAVLSQLLATTGSVVFVHSTPSWLCEVFSGVFVTWLNNILNVHQSQTLLSMEGNFKPNETLRNVFLNLAAY